MRCVYCTVYRFERLLICLALMVVFVSACSLVINTRESLRTREESGTGTATILPDGENFGPKNSIN